MNPTIQNFLHRYSVHSSEPNLLQLQAITAAFSNLPYENVTKILKHTRNSNTGHKLRQMEEVLEDHLRWNTGGTCFSLCNALDGILTACGFCSFIAMADMRYDSNIHCSVVAVLNGWRYLLDPGYLLHDPIALPAEHYEIMRQTPMNTVCVRSESPEVFSLYTIESGQEKWRYRLRARPVSREEFVGHWIHSFSLNTIEHVMLSRVTSSGRIYFRKDRLDLVNPDQRKRESAPNTATLASVFGVPADLILLAQDAVSS